jgi:hypothetical protein
MPTPPTYTSAFKVIGSAAEVSGGNPSWGFYRSPVIGVYTGNRVDRASGTSSYDYDPAAYASITAVNPTLFRTIAPFQLQAEFNPSGDGGFTIGPWNLSMSDNYDYPNVDEVEFTNGIVGGTIEAYDAGAGVVTTFTIAAESGDHNGVAQYPSPPLVDPISAITLP